jgi:hypothetical protein
MGYVANSTAVMTPPLSGYLQIYNGDLEWYAVDYKKTSATVATYEQLVIRWTATSIADADCAIQISPFVTFSSNPGLILTEAEYYSTYQLFAGVPFVISASKTLFGGSVIDGGGIVIRLFGSAKVDFVEGSLTLQKQKQ